MRCNTCGKENPDNVDFCVSCGSALPRSASVGIKCSGISSETGFTTYFREAWRKFARSPLALLTVLCYSAGVLCNWLEIDTASSEWYVFLSSLGWGNWRSEIILEVTLANVISIVDMLPGTLAAVGIWMIYAEGWIKKDRPVRLGGLKLVLTLEVVSMIVLGLTFCVALFMAGRAFLLVLVLAGLIMFLSWVKIAVCITVRDTVQNCMPETRYLKALAIIEFVVGSVNVLGILSGKAADDLGGILNCALVFLLGTLLRKYKALMEDLDAKRVEMEAQSKEEPVQTEPVRDAEYVPAWKRVQMEKENSEQ